MVQIRPNTTGGRPSTRSDEFMFTSLICNRSVQWIINSPRWRENFRTVKKISFGKLLLFCSVKIVAPCWRCWGSEVSSGFVPSPMAEISMNVLFEKNQENENWKKKRNEIYENSKNCFTNFSPDKTSSRARRRVPSLRSSIKSSTRRGGTLWKFNRRIFMLRDVE